MILAKFKQIGN